MTLQISNASLSPLSRPRDMSHCRNSIIENMLSLSLSLSRIAIGAERNTLYVLRLQRGGPVRLVVVERTRRATEAACVCDPTSINRINHRIGSSPPPPLPSDQLQSMSSATPASTHLMAAPWSSGRP